jgi:hypothetical protein
VIGLLIAVILTLIALAEYACHVLPDRRSNGTLEKFYHQKVKREILTTSTTTEVYVAANFTALTKLYPQIQVYN